MSAQAPAKTIALFALAVCVLLPAARLSGKDLDAANPDARFVDELAKRRLYRLADEFCSRRLAASDESSRAAAQVAAAWIRSQAQRAMEAPPHRQAAAWTQLDQTVAEFHELGARGADAALVDVQAALAHLLRGQLQRENAGYGALDGSADQSSFDSAEMDQARASIRTAVAQAKDASRRLDQLLAAAYRERAATNADAAWTIRRLESLRRGAALTLAQAYLQQSLCYPVDSPDRVNALTLALERLEPLTSLEESDPSLAWKARVLQVRCLRLLQAFDRCAAQLQERLSAETPDPARVELLAERIRLLCDRGEFSEALKLGDEAPTSVQDGLPVPELDDAVLEALIGVRNAAQGKRRAMLTDRAAKWSRQIAARHGPYWRRRAEARLGRAIADGAETDDPQLLSSAAKSLYAGGRHGEAIELYDRVAKLKGAAGETDASIDASITAAAILAENGELQAAMRRRIQLATDIAQHPRAAEIHLSAAAAAAELAREAPPDQQQRRLEEYVQLLRSQINRWPEAAATQTAYWWLARYELSLQHWDAAIAHLELVAPTSEFYDDSVRARLECYLAQLESVDTGDRNAAAQQAELVAAATGRLHRVIAGPENQLPQQWTDLQRELAVELVAMQLEHLSAVHAYSEGILHAALAGDDGSNPAWTRRARLLQALASARNGDVKSAEQLLADSSIEPAEALLAARCLRVDKAPAAADQLHRQLGLIALDALRSASTANGATDPTQLQQLQRWEAAALAAAGDRSAALEAYDRLRDAHPNEAEFAVARAELLAEGPEDQQQQALAAWRRVEQRSKPGGTRWFQARRARIDLLSRLGRATQADKLARLTQVLYPGFQPREQSRVDTP